MRATVWFLNLPNEIVEAVNEKGWLASPLAEIYLRLRSSTKREFVTTDVRTALASGLYTLAHIGEADDAETLWNRLQNVDSSWAAEHRSMNGQVRSMDVGDMIVWEDGRTDVCASIGFTEIPAIWINDRRSD